MIARARSGSAGSVSVGAVFRAGVAGRGRDTCGAGVEGSVPGRRRSHEPLQSQPTMPSPDEYDDAFLWELPGTTSSSAEQGAVPSQPARRRAGEPGPREPRAVAEDVPSPTSDEPRTWTVPEVGEHISSLLKSGFPEPFWLVGETFELERTSRRGGPHWYFALVDEQGAAGTGRGQPKRATLSVKMWRRTVEGLFGPRGKLAGVLEPADGVVLRVLVKPDFYAPKGEISFTISDIDPEFTLGSLDRQRREVLRRLELEGALRWNKQVSLPDPPLRIGLVTAAGSAAHQDFLKELGAAGIGFQVLACNARMQGTTTSVEVCAALTTLAGLDVDAICLVRGGGSRLDLSWFDQEDIARAIATCPVPVLTGIGHEIDTSVADAAAHAGFKTPTKVAQWLVERARECLGQAEAVWTAICLQADERLRAEREGLMDTARRAQISVVEGLDEARGRLDQAGERLPALAQRRLEREQHGLQRAVATVGSGVHTEALARHESRMGAAVERLGLIARRGSDQQDQALRDVEERVRLLDPRAILRRGYAWLRRPDGAILKDASDARKGEALTAVMRDGELDLTAGTARPAAEDGASATTDEDAS